ncbi:Peptidase M16 inactive domain protein [Kingella negevensis]|uniref:Peptidase M16 inactive domain protein n=2 Tax=Kingella negevensis TaxID=1522312 RepID=A0A238HH58_9NEIS|nr:Peptidase M16 inactive domain protein [Kingella negevensis]
MADLHKLKPNDLRQWYRRWYAPNNAVLVVVGDVQPENVFAQVEQYFGSLKERKQADHQDISEPETHEKPSFATLKGNTKQPMMMLAYCVPHLQKMDEKLPYVPDTLTNVLDGHSVARFSQRLVRGSQVAQNIGTGYSLLARQPQMWIISASPANGVDLAQLKAALKKKRLLM